MKTRNRKKADAQPNCTPAPAELTELPPRKRTPRQEAFLARCKFTPEMAWQVFIAHHGGEEAAGQVIARMMRRIGELQAKEGAA